MIIDEGNKKYIKPEINIVQIPAGLDLSNIDLETLVNIDDESIEPEDGTK